MWSFKCGGKVREVKVWNDLIAVGCEDGWFYLFDGNGLIWGKKLTATYYRGPFNDVNVLSIDLKDLLAVGTDFADGKVYVFDLDGNLIFERAFVSIMGCWERPKDVVRVSIDECVAVGAEWLKSEVEVLNRRGDVLKSYEVKGGIRDLKVDRDVIVGTTEHLYVGRRRFNKPAFKIFTRPLVFSSDDGVYTLKNGLKAIRKCPHPKIDVSKDLVAVSSERTALISLEGEMLWEVEEKPENVFIRDEDVYLGFENKIKVFRDGKEVREIEVEGLPVYVGDFAVTVKGDKLFYYQL